MKLYKHKRHKIAFGLIHGAGGRSFMLILDDRVT